MSAGPVPVLAFDTLDSTSAQARRLADAGEAGPVWILAARQTAGRGRRGRAWTGIEGNLFATGLFTLDCTPAQAANLSFAAALAVAETLDPYARPGATSLKWPNDVMLDATKAAGILLESWPARTGGIQLSVGIGINLAAAPDPALLERPATCLAAHLGPGVAAPAPRAALDLLAARFAHWLAVWRQDGFAPVRAGWLARASGLGQPVIVRAGDGSERTGLFEDLAPDGALVLRGDDGRATPVHAGDVFALTA